MNGKKNVYKIHVSMIRGPGIMQRSINDANLFMKRVKLINAKSMKAGI